MSSTKKVVRKVQKKVVEEKSAEETPVEKPVEKPAEPVQDGGKVEKPKRTRKKESTGETTTSPEEKPKRVKKVPVEKVPVESLEETAEKGHKKRTFTLVSLTLQDGSNAEIKDGGKYFSKTPAGAARKSANQHCKSLYGDENCQVDVCIKELTKNSLQKEYSYRAIRTLNEKDVNFKGKDGVVNIPFKYSMTLKALKKNEAGEVTEGAVEVIDESVA